MLASMPTMPRALALLLLSFAFRGYDSPGTQPQAPPTVTSQAPSEHASAKASETKGADVLRDEALRNEVLRNDVAEILVFPICGGPLFLLHATGNCWIRTTCQRSRSSVSALIMGRTCSFGRRTTGIPTGSIQHRYATFAWCRQQLMIWTRRLQS
jgi:hypothetical protein